MDKELLLKYREYHFNYFSLLAGQRLKTFNFFIVISAIIFGAFVNVFKEVDVNSTIACILPYLLSTLSFIFWKLDNRTKHMIKTAENAIKDIDDSLLPSSESNHPNILNILRVDDVNMDIQNLNNRGFLRKKFSYSTCFNSIFLIIGVLGFISGSFCIINMLITSC
tara:strand:- start:7619 stop:8116 length:498 start_codon:yes stop_codon:yes gene_type:complete